VILPTSGWLLHFLLHYLCNPFWRQGSRSRLSKNGTTRFSTESHTRPAIPKDSISPFLLVLHKVTSDILQYEAVSFVFKSLSGFASAFWAGALHRLLGNWSAAWTSPGSILGCAFSKPSSNSWIDIHHTKTQLFRRKSLTAIHLVIRMTEENESLQKTGNSSNQLTEGRRYVARSWRMGSGIFNQKRSGWNQGCRRWNGYLGDEHILIGPIHVTMIANWI
jgi:hypothetical protein